MEDVFSPFLYSGEVPESCHEPFPYPKGDILPPLKAVEWLFADLVQKGRKVEFQKQVLKKVFDGVSGTRMFDSAYYVEIEGLGHIISLGVSVPSKRLNCILIKSALCCVNGRNFQNIIHQHVVDADEYDVAVWSGSESLSFDPSMKLGRAFKSIWDCGRKISKKAPVLMLSVDTLKEVIHSFKCLLRIKKV